MHTHNNVRPIAIDTCMSAAGKQRAGEEQAGSRAVHEKWMHSVRCVLDARWRTLCTIAHDASSKNTCAKHGARTYVTVPATDGCSLCTGAHADAELASPTRAALFIVFSLALK